MHPRYLSHYLTDRDVAGWIAWMQKTPRGDRRLDWNIALLTANLRNAWNTGAPESPNQFLPKFGRSRTIKDPEIRQLADDFMKPITL